MSISVTFAVTFTFSQLGEFGSRLYKRHSKDTRVGQVDKEVTLNWILRRQYSQPVYEADTLQTRCVFKY